MSEKKMNKPDAKVELRSEKVRRIVREMPKSLYWWSVGILFIILLIIVFILCTMPFPFSDGKAMMHGLLKSLFGLS